MTQADRGSGARWVHVADDLGPGALDELRGRCPGLQITGGDEPPADSAYDVLVAGRPAARLLSASAQLRALVVPHAGVPADTRDALADRPDISVRTLHHNAGPTAELAVALLLAAAKSLVPADRDMRTGSWVARFRPPDPTLLLDGRGALVLGYGAVGRRVARSLSALGMRVRATRHTAAGVTRDGDVEVHPAAALRALLPESVALVVAVPSTPDTRGLVGAAELALLPRPAGVVNVARADIVDEDALYDALRGGGLAAGLDVWWTEAQQLADARGVTASRRPFHELDNVVLSPHRAGGFALPEVQALQRQHLAALLADFPHDD